MPTLQHQNWSKSAEFHSICHGIGRNLWVADDQLARRSQRKSVLHYTLHISYAFVFDSVPYRDIGGKCGINCDFAVHTRLQCSFIVRNGQFTVIEIFRRVQSLCCPHFQFIWIFSFADHYWNPKPLWFELAVLHNFVRSILFLQPHNFSIHSEVRPYISIQQQLNGETDELVAIGRHVEWGRINNHPLGTKYTDHQ